MRFYYSDDPARDYAATMPSVRKSSNTGRYVPSARSTYRKTSAGTSMAYTYAMDVHKRRIW